MSLTICLGDGVVADLVLEHHRANFRPRVVVAPPLDPPAADAVPIRPVAAVTHVLVIRFIACLVLWAAGGTVYGFWQLGNALTPSNPHGEVTCVLSHGAGSIPGC